jgi:hypothetical protein
MGWNTTNGHSLWWYLGCLLKVHCQLILVLYISFNYTWLTLCVCWNSQTQSYGTKPEPNYNDSCLNYGNPASDGGCNQAGQNIGCNGFGEIFFWQAYKQSAVFVFFSPLHITVCNFILHFVKKKEKQVPRSL